MLIPVILCIFDKIKIMKPLKLLSILFFIPFLGNAQNTNFKRVKPCSFGIDLPVEMRLTKMYQESSPDYCDYEVRLQDGSSVIELHSLLNSRFTLSNIREAYYSALKSSELDITYQFLGRDFFIISGMNPNNGKTVYWKRVWGSKFVSDLNIEYSPSKRGAIEKHIARISKSFTSD